MRNYRNYTDDNIKLAASQSKSMGQLLKALNLKPCGGNYANMKRRIQQLEIDCSHWRVGHDWWKDKQIKDWSNYSRASNAKKHLIKLRLNTCECCKNTEWLGQLIKLEIHHIDGNKTNNSLENLQLLCPNCHSYTSNFRKPTKDLARQ